MPNEVHHVGYVDVDPRDIPLGAADAPGDEAHDRPPALRGAHQGGPAVARAGVLPGDSSGADEGLLVEGEGGSEARLLQAGLASEGVDDGDVHLLQDLLEIAARLEGVLAPAGDPARLPVEDLAGRRQTRRPNVRVLIHVDRLGEVQQSHVVEESLVVEVGVNDDPVNRDFEVGEVGVVLALADVVLAQADFEAPLVVNLVSRGEDPVGGHEDSAALVAVAEVQDDHHPRVLAEGGLSILRLPVRDGVLAAAARPLNGHGLGRDGRGTDGPRGSDARGAADLLTRDAALSACSGPVHDPDIKDSSAGRRARTAVVRAALVHGEADAALDPSDLVACLLPCLATWNGLHAQLRRHETQPYVLVVLAAHQDGHDGHG